MKSPAARLAQSGWSEAVPSGTHDLNRPGLTPMTLADVPPILICAPSKVIIFLTPLIACSLATCPAVSPRGKTISRSGRMMPLKTDLPVVEAAGWPEPAGPEPADTEPPASWLISPGWFDLHPASAMTRTTPAVSATDDASTEERSRGRQRRVLSRRMAASGCGSFMALTL